MFRLRVKVSKKRWLYGIQTYETLELAKQRQVELSKVGIVSFVVDYLGNKVREI